jgi:hypothetical protein
MPSRRAVLTRPTVTLWDFNKNVPLRTKREYARDNRERIRRWNRVYQTFTNRESYVRYQRLYAKEKEKCLYSDSFARQGRCMRDHLLKYHFTPNDFENIDEQFDEIEESINLFLEEDT